jgi:integrase
LIASGVDPIQRKRDERAAETTFAEAANGWIDTHKTEWRGGDDGSQMRNAKLLLHHHGASLSGKPVAEITADLIESTLTDLWARSPAQARRTLAMFERVLDYARAKGLRTGDNPASWRGMHEYRFPRRRKVERAHFAAMPYDAVPEFIQVLRQRQGRSTAAIALEFLILTAARSGEVLNASWSEIDFDQKLWTIPATRAKQGREHRFPLPDRAMELLARQGERSRGSPYVFTGYRPNDPLAEKAMMWVLRHVGTSATVHGFRSSFRDWAGDTTTFQREAIEECFGHAVGNGVERSYRRQDGREKRRVIMQTWANYCEGR